MRKPKVAEMIITDWGYYDNHIMLSNVHLPFYVLQKMWHNPRLVAFPNQGIACNNL